MASQKLVYPASSNLTFTSLNSLAASSSLTAGAQSSAVDNTSNLYVDYGLTGLIVAGASNVQAGLILVYVVPMLDDTNWPDTFGASDAARTATSANVLAAAGAVAASIGTDAVASRSYPFKLVSVASLFGGFLPPKWVVFVTHTAHTSTNTLAAAGHQITIKPEYFTVA